MPTYEYSCKKCKHTFETFQSIVSKPVTICPKCHNESVERLISGGVGIIFKGSGFYETDYRSDNYTKAQKADEPTTKKDTSKDKTKKEPAAKKSPKKKDDKKKSA